MKALPMAALLVALVGGVASADRVVVHGGGRGGGGRVVVHEGGRGGWHGNVGVRGHVRGAYDYGRRPISMHRPFIRERYYNRSFRPGLIVEDYPVRDGYIWVRGSWGWNGAEWIWSPGYYQPIY